MPRSLQNVDLETGTAKMSDTLVPVDGAAEHRIDVTKPKKSRRVIALEEWSLATLNSATYVPLCAGVWSICFSFVGVRESDSGFLVGSGS